MHFIAFPSIEVHFISCCVSSLPLSPGLSFVLLCPFLISSIYHQNLVTMVVDSELAPKFAPFFSFVSEMIYNAIIPDTLGIC